MSDKKWSGRTETIDGRENYFELRGSGAPLVLLHGFTGSSHDWQTLPSEWCADFQLIAPDLRGHGRSRILAKPFRHREAAMDIVGLLDRLEITSCRAIGISGGGNILLHVASEQGNRVKAMVLVSATPYFPEQARPMMRDSPNHISEVHREALRRAHSGGDAQIRALLDSAAAFADSYDDMNLTADDLSKITARTLLVQGDRDPFYPLEISVKMAEAIPHASLRVVPNGGHVPVTGDRWQDFLDTAEEFLHE